ncbi:MAG: threonine aldolase, partial [Deltaproteobacteria bacterium]|nr:threonine aldolase [Deltaproteobacteria bacterium]
MTANVCFASDNTAGAHSAVLAAIEQANAGNTIGYGDDEYSARAIARFNKQFGEDIDVFFAYNGTAANVLSLSACMDSFNAVICADI